MISTSTRRVRVGASPPKKPAVILIFGMHRSGTSFLANALAAAGVPFGSNLLSESAHDNPDGYCEHAEIVEIQETLLRRLGREWYGKSSPSPLPKGWMTWPETLEARDRLMAVIERELLLRPLWAVKDPRTTRLLPLWLEILAEAGIRAIPILCIRNPTEIARSLWERNGMPEGTARAIWMAYQTDVLAVFGNKKILVVDYARFLSDPKRTLVHTLQALGVDSDPEHLRAAVAISKPHLQHHVASLELSDCESSRLYVDLLAAAQGSRRRLPNVTPQLASTTESRVTVVMRTRDRPLFLSRAIRSVLVQTMSDWHLVIVNDGGLQDIVDLTIDPYRAGLAGRLTVLHLQNNVGMEAASNLAIRERCETLITIHDDDDSWDPRFLQVCCSELLRTGAAGVVTASALAYERVEGSVIIDDGRERYRSDVTAITLAAMARENLFPPIAFVFRRIEWEAIGGYRASLPVLGDWDFNLRFLARRPISFVPELLAYWHRRPAADPFPNTAESLHRQVEATVRDDMLRATGDQGLGIISALMPLVERAVCEAAKSAAQSVVSGIGSGSAGLERIGAVPASSVPAIPATFLACRLTPTNVEHVKQGHGHASSSTGVDPQLHYELGANAFWPGMYGVTLQLKRPANAGAVELFFSSNQHHSQERKVFLQEERPGYYRGEFSSKDLVGHLRVDPMEIAGEFEAGLLTVERLQEAQRSPRLPDFLCIGAQRSGTTWLYDQLRLHPALFLPPCKELHFFDEVDGIERDRLTQQRLDFLAGAQSTAAASPLDRDGPAWRQLEWAARFAVSRHIDINWYASLFADAAPGIMTGEVTPSYAILPERIVKSIVQMMPNLKVVFIMRNPVERAISGALHELMTVAGAAAVPSEAAISAELATSRCVSRSSYRQTIEVWEGCLTQGSLGCFFYDDIMRDPHGLMGRVFNFLGVAANLPLSGNVRVRVNHNTMHPPRLGVGVMQGLAARYRQDVEWLQQRFGGATKGWLNALGNAEAPDYARK